MDELAEQEHACELAEMANASRRDVECVEHEACVVAEPAVRPDHVPAARHFVSIVEAVAGREDGMA